MTQNQFVMKTDIGTLYLVASEKGLQTLTFDKQPVMVIKKLDPKSAAHRHLRDASEQLQEYFKKKRRTFNLSLDFTGTAFQQNVWKALSEIPFGQTLSYKQLAQKIKKPKAVRAVGTANGRNPLCIIIPCHRVIAANGKLGGYSGGLHYKKKLLSHENLTWL